MITEWLQLRESNMLGNKMRIQEITSWKDMNVMNLILT